MFRLLSPAVLLGFLLIFNSCERHHLGELPEVQQEHLHPLDAATTEKKAIEPTPPPVSSAASSPNDKP